MTDRYIGFWYLGWPGHHWLLVVMRSASGDLHSTSRILHPDGDRTTQALERPGLRGPDSDAIDLIRKMVADVTSQFLVKFNLQLSSPGVLLDEVIVCGDDAKARRLLRNRPWVIADVVLPEERN